MLFLQDYEVIQVDSNKQRNEQELENERDEVLLFN